ncbi:MAG: 2OG-Fe(II) oxygenase [Myxococcales bacterium]|nr:2OG-Fe(II) oxygenase [Myxococcales bacterium]
MIGPMASASRVRGRGEGAAERLAKDLAVHIEQAVEATVAAAWAEGVLRAKSDWTAAFGGEQHSLGRAFYTHLEQGTLDEYFADAPRSDERVEAAAPGLQSTMRALVARVTGADVVARRDFCGPGVHIFSPEEKVAREGGVVHFDTEGLPARHRTLKKPALSLVLMLSAPSEGGGLSLWDVRYEGQDAVPRRSQARAAKVTVHSRAGDAVLFDSYVLHQILPFAGTAHRVSATVHAAEVEAGRWETWF